MERLRLRAEIGIVLLLSLGKAAVYSIVALVGMLTAKQALAQHTAALNAPLDPRPWLDLAYQLLGLIFPLVPVVLVVFLLASEAARDSAGTEEARSEVAEQSLAREGDGVVAAGEGDEQQTADVAPRIVARASLREALANLGLGRERWGRCFLAGAALAAVIGLPGLGFYLAGRMLGITAQVSAASLGDYWWSVPVLLLAALENAVLEEVLVVGYLGRRLRQLGYSGRAFTAFSALLRGTYHLYQGFGPGIGNAIMGIVFAQWGWRTGRVWPLVVAHTLIDVVAFLGYFFLSSQLGGLF